MIKVCKNLTDVPDSLRVDSISIEKDPAKTTHARRMEVITQGRYPDSGKSKKFDDRYKYKDIKEKLNLIYHHKCAFCETSVELLHVDHFRPKRGGYYWLAFSWDNLLLLCPKCNEFKSDLFPTNKARVQYDSSRDEIGKIHSLSATYDNLEEPLLVNPETLDPSIFDQLVFDKNGQISSSDKRLSKTVSICHLCRPYLNERRKKIWDDLEKEIRYAVLTEQTKEGLAGAFNTILTTFKAKMNDPEKPYIAFRKYILRKDWIKELLKGLGVII